MNARARWSRHQARWVGGFNASSYAPKIVGKVALGRKLCQFPCRALRLKPLKPINHLATVEKSINLGRKGANKAQERAQTLAHGHPWGLGRSLARIFYILASAAGAYVDVVYFQCTIIFIYNYYAHPISMYVVVVLGCST